MLEIHHFTYGFVTPMLAYASSFTGSLLGLECSVRAHTRPPGIRRNGWLVSAAAAIGGTGIWVMHFIAMLGCTISGTPIRYDVALTLFSALIAVVVVGMGLFIVNSSAGLMPLFLGGAITGIGVAAMHYTGMAAIHTDAVISYDPLLVAISVVIAVVAATAALWLTMQARGWRTTVPAAAVMGVAVCSMHYTGMAAMRAHATAVMDTTSLPMPMPPGAGGLQLLSPIIVAASLITALLLLHVGLEPEEDEEF